MRCRAGILLVTVSLLLAACNDFKRQNSIGDAYVGPATTSIRRELAKRESTVATLKHGDHVQITDVRRRYLKVRSDSGAEGWLDSSQLIGPDQMDLIRKQTAQARNMQSQGSASVFESLNVHIQPDRQSVSFMKIPENGKVNVLAHRVAPRILGRPPATTLKIAKPEPPARRTKHEKANKTAALRPPKPPAPTAPHNWQALSSERLPSAKEAEKKEPEKPAVYEDWTFIQTSDHQAGWVLSRNLVMSVPDEVAQYAEGKRITSYFDLGSVQDEEKGLKHNWLWTTSSSVKPYDFTAFRIFIWNRRRHRYETSYRSKEVEGYFPVTLERPDKNSPAATFSLILRDENKAYWKNRYVFDGMLVRLSGREAFQPSTSDQLTKTAEIAPEQAAARKPQRLNWFWRQLRFIRQKLGLQK